MDRIWTAPRRGVAMVLSLTLLCSQTMPIFAFAWEEDPVPALSQVSSQPEETPDPTQESQPTAEPTATGVPSEAPPAEETPADSSAHRDPGRGDPGAHSCPLFRS